MLRRDVGVATSIRSPSLSGNRAITSRTCSQTPRRLVTASGREPASRSRLSISGRRRMERETGIEPATNSLEGCDSTTELLPPSFTHFAPNFGEASPAFRSLASLRTSAASLLASFSATARQAASSPWSSTLGGVFSNSCRCLATSSARPALRSSLTLLRRAKVGGEGRTRTFEAARATDLQSAAFDRFATSPGICLLESVCSTRTLLSVTVSVSCVSV
jgi:hypothetical protein